MDHESNPRGFATCCLFSPPRPDCLSCPSNRSQRSHKAREGRDVCLVRCCTQCQNNVLNPSREIVAVSNCLCVTAVRANWNKSIGTLPFINTLLSHFTHSFLTLVNFDLWFLYFVLFFMLHLLLFLLSRSSRTVWIPMCPETGCCGIPSLVVSMHSPSTQLTLSSSLFTMPFWVRVLKS